MKNENKAMIVVVAYITVMLIVCVVAITMIKKEATDFDENAHINCNTAETPEKEIIYVPVYVESDIKETEKVKEASYMIKEYEGKIGVFSENEALIQIIDINIKALPEADRRMLEKGFYVNGKAELNAIIEDYTA